MAEAQPLEEDEYAEFYEIDEPVIQFEVRVNEIQHIQCSIMEIAEEQAKDKVWSEVIRWVEQGQAGYISRSCTQHQGDGCSVSVEKRI